MNRGSEKEIIINNLFIFYLQTQWYFCIRSLILTMLLLLLFWLFILFILKLPLFLPPPINNSLLLLLLAWIKLFSFFLFDTKFKLLPWFVDNKVWLGYCLVIYWLLLLLLNRCEFVGILVRFSRGFLVLLVWLNSGRLMVYCGNCLSDESYCGACCCRFYTLCFRLTLLIFCSDNINYCCCCCFFYWLYWLKLFYFILFGFGCLMLL